MQKTCEILSCNRKYLAKGLCSLHYQRKKLGVPLDKPIPQRYPQGSTCSYKECEDKPHGDGMCKYHYDRSKKDRCPECGNEKWKRSEFCRSCRDKKNVGVSHPAWKGGRIIDGDGYVRIYTPDDPRANCGRYMKEHILVMEQELGRHLLPGENVHHKNGLKADNRPENLELWISSQPAGQRVEDLVAWAKEILKRYDQSG